MKKRIVSIIGVLVAHMILLSCSTPIAEISIGVDDENINKQILVSAPEDFNSYTTADPIVFEIRSYSPNEIRFPNNFNLRIFQQTNGGWVEIQEKPITRLPEHDIVFSAQTSTIKDLAVFPELVDRSKTYQLRLYVIGDMKDNDENIKVAAYLDVQLGP